MPQEILASANDHSALLGHIRTILDLRTVGQKQFGNQSCFSVHAAKPGR